MSKAYESIMRGLGEIESHQKGKVKLRTNVLMVEPTPRYDAKAVKRIRQSSSCLNARLPSSVECRTRRWRPGNLDETCRMAVRAACSS